MTETRKKETFPREMAGEGKARSEDLNLCFEKLMMLAFGGGKSGSSEGGVKMEGAVIPDWKDIPVELLLRIVSLVDDRTVIMASGVCSGWRDAICMGLPHLCLSWYNLFSLSMIINMLFQLFLILLGFSFCLCCVNCVSNCCYLLFGARIIMLFQLLECFIPHSSLYLASVLEQFVLGCPLLCSEAMIKTLLISYMQSL
jgi:hypothetical protein